MIFVRMSAIPEVLAYLTGTNTYLLYLVGPPALFGVIMSGGLGRVFKSKVAWSWTALILWMLLAIPFSSWVGNSATLVTTYVRTDFICLLVLAGAVANWKQLQTFYNMMALGGGIVLVVIKFLAKPDGEGRLSLDVYDSTIGNPNDLAAHVILVLPFILYYGFQPGRSALMRILVSGAAFYGIMVILATSSRGAMVGLTAMALILFAKANGRIRAALLVGVPLLTMVLIAILPSQNLERLKTIFGSDSSAEGIAGEAGESSESRSYLLKKSIQFTKEHPVFGVGPGQFANFEGLAAKALGEHGNWHETHNTYTEISSECGFPALVFALGGLLGAWFLVNKTYRHAKEAGNTLILGMCACFLVSWTGYLVTLTFLASAYRFTLPSMLSLAMAIHIAGEKALRETPTPAPAELNVIPTR